MWRDWIIDTTFIPTQTFLMKELPPVSHSEKTYGFHTLRQLAESPDMLDRGSVGRIRFIGPMDFDGALCHDRRSDHRYDAVPHQYIYQERPFRVELPAHT